MTQEFDIRADDYEANRHFFPSQYFVDQYDAMESLPVPNSGAMINRIEVYVVNMQANVQDVRNIAFTDLGEHPDYISSNLPIGELVDNTSVFTEGGPSKRPRSPRTGRPTTTTTTFSEADTRTRRHGFHRANEAISSALSGDFKQGVHYERWAMPVA